MAARTLTSANSVLTLSVAGLFDAPRRIQGFGTDAMFGTEAIELAETQMGVDGNFSAGWIPNPVTMTITLQADSTSNDFFETIFQAEQSANVREKYVLGGSLLVTSLQREFALIRGFLTRFQVIPEAAKTFRPRAVTIMWGSVTARPV